MIIVEKIGECERRYSDLGVKLLQTETNTFWNDAINVIPCRFNYIETDIPVDASDEDIVIEDKAAAYDILMGEKKNDSSI